jgi:hypothetical protein
MTFYTRHGDIFAIACTLLSLALITYLCAKVFLRHKENLKKRKKA